MKVVDIEAIDFTFTCHLEMFVNQEESSDETVSCSKTNTYRQFLAFVSFAFFKIRKIEHHLEQIYTVDR